VNRWPLLSALAAVLSASGAAHADPLRLRAEALATTQAPAGLLVIDTEASASATVDAEAMVWMAADPVPGQRHGDVLVMVLRGRTEDGRAAGRVGRFVATLGALRPVHVDGGAGRVRLPHQVDVEAYAGVPVVPAGAGDRAWDWIAGGRVARRLGDYGSVGLAILEQRDAGRLYNREVGVDAGAAIGKHHDVASRVAYDLVEPGIVDAYLTVARRKHKLRSEAYVGHRSASRLLPATSLFTVLGDTPSQRAGMLVQGKVAPRLEVTGDLGVRRIGDELAPILVLRGRLALDDRGKSALTGELRRDGVGADAWTGARGAARIALPHRLIASTELELVVPDTNRGRGRVWPWVLAALGWQRDPWHAAVAFEASASAEFRHRVDVLFQLVRTWGQTSGRIK
jgi:hypothetical protein